MSTQELVAAFPLLASEAFRSELLGLLRDSEVWRFNELAKSIKMSRSKIERMVASASMPKPMKSGRMLCWPAGRVRCWLRLNCPSENVLTAIERLLYDAENAE
jgi:predicted DNA-binding transcriptional regulator AlpA